MSAPSPSQQPSQTVLNGPQAAIVSAMGKMVSGFLKGLVPQTILYGLYLAVMIYSVIVHARKKSISRPTLVMFIVSVLMFISTTTQFFVNFAGLLKQTNAMLLDTSQLDLKRRMASLSTLNIPFNVSENWFTTFNFICSDIIVVWRAWALCSDKRVLLLIPGFFLLGTTVAGLVYAGFGTLAGNPATTPISTLKAWAFSQLVHNMFSFLANASATALVWWKAWTHRRLALASNGYRARTYGSEDILMLLLESGIVYCGLQAVYVILIFVFRFGDIDTPTFAPVLASYQGSLFIISGLYPSLIVVIVSMQKSISETSTFKGGMGSTAVTVEMPTISTNWSTTYDEKPKVHQASNASISSLSDHSVATMARLSPPLTRDENGKTWV